MYLKNNSGLYGSGFKSYVLFDCIDLENKYNNNK